MTAVTSLKIVTSILNYYLPLAVMYALYTKIFVEASQLIIIIIIQSSLRSTASCRHLKQPGYSTSGPVSTGMGDRLQQPTRPTQPPALSEKLTPLIGVPLQLLRAISIGMTSHIALPLIGGSRDIGGPKRQCKFRPCCPTAETLLMHDLHKAVCLQTTNMKLTTLRVQTAARVDRPVL